MLTTSAFLLGVPWALAYSEEQQYVQMEREQGMIKGANEVSLRFFRPLFTMVYRLLLLPSASYRTEANIPNLYL